MKNKELGETDAIKGTLHGIKYNIFCMKVSEFTMKLMTTYGSLTASASAKEPNDYHTRIIKTTD